MAFTAEDYRTAIKVLRAHSCETLAEGFLDFEARANKREVYAYNLANVIDPRDAQMVVGLTLISKLLDDGWTPPTGVL